MKKTMVMCGLSAIGLLSLISGCGSSNGSDGTAVATKLATTVTDADGFTITLAEDKSTVASGQTANFTVTLTNTSGAPIVYTPTVGCVPPTLISGIETRVSLTNNASQDTSELPPDPGIACGAIGYGPAVTLQPGATLTGTVGSGTVLNTHGSYTVEVDIAITFGDELNDPGNVVPRTIRVGSLAVTSD